MTEEPHVRLELLQDEKGVYGLFAKDLPEGWDRLKPIITRPDRVIERDEPSSAALQMLPSSKRFKNSAEGQLLEAIIDCWGKETAKKRGLERLPPKDYFALTARCRRIINSLLFQALAVANPEYLRTARRYPVGYRWLIYRACCLYGERAHQIANTFPLAAAMAYCGVYEIVRSDANYESVSSRCAELRELVQKGSPLAVIAKAMHVPKMVRYILPANVSRPRWGCLAKNPEFFFYMPRTTHKQRRWFSALNVALDLRVSSDFVGWVARHSLELGDSHGTVASTLRDFSDWLKACDDKLKQAELESLKAKFEVLALRATALGKWVYNPIGFDSNFQFVTRIFTPDMSTRTVQTLCDQWHEAFSMAKCPGQEIAFPGPWYEGSDVNGYTITPIRTRLELFRHGRTMHNCSATYAGRIIRGECFFYEVTKDGKCVATLMIEDKDGQTVLSDLRTMCNGRADNNLKSAVTRWLTKNKRLYGNGNRPEKRTTPAMKPQDAVDAEELAFFKQVLAQ